MNKKIKFYVCFLIVAFSVGLLFASCNGCRGYKKIREGEIKPQKANKEEGKFLLKNLAMAEITFSTIQGGEGNSRFTGDPQKLAPYASAKAISALTHAGDKENPFEGYIVILKEKKQGDNFATDFCIEARPAKGFVGVKMQISKDETITEIKE